VNSKARGLIIALCIVSAFLAGVTFGMEMKNREILILLEQIRILEKMNARLESLIPKYIIPVHSDLPIYKV